MERIKDPTLWAVVGIVMLAIGAVSQDKVLVLLGGVVAALFTSAWWVDRLF